MLARQPVLFGPHVGLVLLCLLQVFYLKINSPFKNSSISHGNPDFWFILKDKKFIQVSEVLTCPPSLSGPIGISIVISAFGVLPLLVEVWLGLAL